MQKKYHWDFTSDYLHYVINDLYNALFSIDRNAPMLFAEVYETLLPTIEECNSLKAKLSAQIKEGSSDSIKKYLNDVDTYYNANDSVN